MENRLAHSIPYLSVPINIFLKQYLCESIRAHPYPIIFLMLASTTSDLGSKCILLSSEGRVIHNTMVVTKIKTKMIFTDA